MHVDLNLQQMRSCMDLWRQELSLGDRVRGATARAQVLANVRGTLAGWLDLLSLCSADGAGQKELTQIATELADFIEWLDEAQFAHAIMRHSKHI